MAKSKIDQSREARVTATTWKNASERERSAIHAAELRTANRPERVRVKVEKTATGLKTTAAVGGVQESLSLQLADALGTTSPPFINATLGSIATFIGSCKNGDVNSSDVSAALAVLDGMKPENEVEAMLLTQMWATNESALRALGMIGKSEWINQTALFGNLAVKLLRTYAAQVEALAKLRRKGEQTVKIVHVHEGGQAMIAETINSGGGVDEKASEQSHATGASPSGGAALLGQDEAWVGVPVSSRTGAQAVPDARWHERGTT